MIYIYMCAEKYLSNNIFKNIIVTSNTWSEIFHRCGYNNQGKDIQSIFNRILSLNINYSHLPSMDGGFVEIPKSQISVCGICMLLIYKRSKMCKKCSAKHRYLRGLGRKVCRPSLTQLNTDLHELKSKVKVGKKYNVADNTINKWLKMYKKYE